jgi:hypothetical protein
MLAPALFLDPILRILDVARLIACLLDGIGFRPGKDLGWVCTLAQRTAQCILGFLCFP